jgi:hypothetical protein
VGLSNTNARLQQLYGIESRVELTRTANGGAEARIVLPYHRSPVLHPVGAVA